MAEVCVESPNQFGAELNVSDNSWRSSTSSERGNRCTNLYTILNQGSTAPSSMMDGIKFFASG